MRWRVAAPRRRRSSAPGSAARRAIEDRSFPSCARRLARLPQPVVMGEQPAQREVGPEGRQRADLLAERGRVGAGLIGRGPQPRQRHVPAPEPEQACPVDPGSRQQSAQRRLEQDIHRQNSPQTASSPPATPISNGAQTMLANDPVTQARRRSDDGAAGRRAPRPQRRRLQPFQHGRARPRPTCSWSIRRACTGRRSRRPIW